MPLDPCSRCRRHVVRGRACPFCARRGELVFGVAIVASLTAASCDRKPEDSSRDDTRDMRAEYGVARPPPDASVRDAGTAPPRDPVRDLTDDLRQTTQKYGVPRPPIVPSARASGAPSASPKTKTPDDDPLK